MVTLYHYTCDHGREGIGERGFVWPIADLTDKATGDLARFAWFTDMVVPDRLALGLTSTVLSCDRLAHRYRVDDYFADALVPWVSIRRLVAADVREALEGAPRARPKHWWVCRRAAPVTYDPVVAP